MIPKNARIAIFDFDGVIIDSEEISAEVASGLIKEKFGFTLSEDDRRKKYGTFDPDYYSLILKKYAIAYDWKKLLKEHNRIYDRLILEIKEPLQGVKEALEFLVAKNFRVAMCSSSFKHQINSVLKNLGLQNYFSAIISAEETSKHKPDPQPYMLLAKKLNANPSECIVFEDSRHGVLAAKMAEMYCIGVEIGNHGTQDLSLADEVIYSFSELKMLNIQ